VEGHGLKLFAQVEIFLEGHGFSRAVQPQLMRASAPEGHAHIRLLFNAMPGYSGTPLAKKLGIKDNFRIALLHVPNDVKTELRDAFEKCRPQPLNRADLDFIFLFAKSRAALSLDLMPAAKALAPAGMLWIAWPKKSSGVSTDLTEDVVRGCGLDAGLVDIKVCAVTAIWSGLKFVIPVKNRPKKKR
jgi:hypothetical protein